jgi:uncharacterized protein YjiS (DUF1127 family)
MEMKMEMHTRASLRAIHGIDGHARAPLSLGAWLSKLVKRMQEAERFRRDYATLMAKSDRELRDIGLTRGDVVEAFRYGRRRRTAARSTTAASGEEAFNEMPRTRVLQIGAVAVCGALIGQPALSAPAHGASTERVNVSSNGSEANDDSGDSSVSADGRFVAFGAEASNLVPGDANGVPDVFVHDRHTGVVERVSIAGGASYPQS